MNTMSTSTRKVETGLSLAEAQLLRGRLEGEIEGLITAFERAVPGVVVTAIEVERHNIASMGEDPRKSAFFGVQLRTELVE